MNRSSALNIAGFWKIVGLSAKDQENWLADSKIKEREPDASIVIMTVSRFLNLELWRSDTTSLVVRNVIPCMEIESHAALSDNDYE